MHITFTRNAAERQAIYRLRYDVYIDDWGASFQRDDERRLTDDSDETARLLMAEQDGQVVGTMRVHWGADGPFSADTRGLYDLARFESVVPSAKMAVFSRFAVRRDARGTPVSFGVLAKAWEFSLDNGVELGFCDCQPHLVHHYMKLGWRTYAPTLSDPVAGLLVPLVLVFADVVHLQRIGSPVLFLYEGRTLLQETAGRVLEMLQHEPPVRALGTHEEAARWAAEYGRSAAGHATEGILDGIDGERLARLIARGQVLSCRRGDTVIREGMGDRTIFVILDGTVEIRIDGITINVAVKGDAIGEMAFLMGGQRRADAVAASDDVSVLALHDKNLRDLGETDPTTAAVFFKNIARGLSHKLAAANRRVSD